MRGRSGRGSFGDEQSGTNIAISTGLLHGSGLRGSRQGTAMVKSHLIVKKFIYDGFESLVLA